MSAYRPSRQVEGCQFQANLRQIYNWSTIFPQEKMSQKECKYAEQDAATVGGHSQFSPLLCSLFSQYAVQVDPPVSRAAGVLFLVRNLAAGVPTRPLVHPPCTHRILIYKVWYS